MHCVGCCLSHVRHVRPLVIAKKCTSTCRGCDIPPIDNHPPKQFALLFDDVTCIWTIRVQVGENGNYAEKVARWYSPNMVANSAK